MTGRPRPARGPLAYRNFRLLLAAKTVSMAGDWLYGVAVLVYVYDRTGSAAWVAAAGALKALPFVVLAPVGGLAADRFDRRKVLLISDLTLTAVMIVGGLAVLAEAHVTVVIATSLLASALATAYMPAVMASIPAVVDERDLASANALSSAVENVALAIGPALGGLLLLLGDASIPFFVNAGTFALSALLIAGLEMRRSRDAALEQQGRLVEHLKAGFRAVTSSRDVVLLLTAVVASSMLWGQELVLLVFISERFLSMGSAGSAFLFAAVGTGGLLGAVFSSRIGKVAQPGHVLIASMLMSGMALMALSFARVPWIAYALVALDGAGAVILDVLVMTILQRTVSQAVLARVFGILASLTIGGILLGSLAAPLVFAAGGLQSAVFVAGAVLPLVALIGLPRFRRLNERAEKERLRLGSTVARLEGYSIFRGASPATLELVARNMREQRVAPGQMVVEEGEVADALYLVREGSLAVYSAGETSGPRRRVNTLSPGDYFGEIGLLEGIARTATVQAEVACVLDRIAGEDFLAFVSGVTAVPGLQSAMTVRLSRTHPSLQPRFTALREPSSDD